MATRWGNNGNSDRLYFGRFQNHCRWWLKTWNLKNAYSLEENLWPTRQHIKKQRHYFASKGLSSQSYSFFSSHVWMWELDHKESWVLKNWWFQIMVVQKSLESPLTSRESNQSILKKINPEYSLEGLMLKLKLQSFGHLMQWANSLEKSLILGKIEDRRGGWQRVRQLDGIIFSMDMSVSKLWQIVKDRKAWCAAVHVVAKYQTQLSNWTTATKQWVLFVFRASQQLLLLMSVILVMASGYLPYGSMTPGTFSTLFFY